MQKVSLLIKHLFQQSYQLSPVRLTLHNYLKSFVPEDAELNNELIDGFISSCLEYPHWQQNRKLLQEELQEIIDEFHIISEVSIPIESIKPPSQRQVIELEHWQDSLDVTKQFIQKKINHEEETYRLISDSQKRSLVLILNAANNLTVRIFDKKFYLNQGILEPLKQQQTLHYNKQLDLVEGVYHQIEIAPYVMAIFKIQGQKVYGSMVRGYIFQKFQEFSGESLPHIPKLFYALKRVEQFFISRNTDPYYQEIVTALEKSTQQLTMGTELSTEASFDLLTRAQNALEYVFVGDKVLNLLIKEYQNLQEMRNVP